MKKVISLQYPITHAGSTIRHVSIGVPIRKLLPFFSGTDRDSIDSNMSIISVSTGLSIDAVGEMDLEDFRTIFDTIETEFHMSILKSRTCGNA